MKTFRKALTLVLSLMMIICMSGLAVFADDVTEDYKGTTYKIKFYSGKEGSFGSEKMVEVPAKYGDNITVDLDGDVSINGTKKASFGFSVKNPAEYYARGFKIAGHDNDETTGDKVKPGGYYRSFTVPVTGDTSYSVAYGIEGGLVKYVVNYLDDNGNALHPSGEFYGMPGDYPVVSFKYIEGYAPEAYNLGKTLSSNEADNVFTFRYSESDLTAEEQAQQAATTGRRTAAGAANAANGGANAGANNADGTAIGDNATPAAGAPNVVDLDDGNTPQAAPQSDVPKSELSRQKTMGFIIGGVCVAAAIAAAAVAIARRRQYEYEDDDE